jgi:uncharacterized phage infection (PIP) family protein YhgE
MNKILKWVIGASLVVLGVFLGTVALTPGNLVPAESKREQPRLSAQRDTLLILSDALKMQAEALNPQTFSGLAAVLERTAEALVKQSQAARSAARDLEDTAEALLVWAEVCREFLNEVQIDLELAGQVHTSLTTFSDGSKSLEKILEMPQVPAIRDGLGGLDRALTTAATDIEDLASVTYPRFYWNGKWPAYEWVAVFPNGYQIAEGLRQAAEGIRSANKELETLGKELPRIRRAVESSRKVLEKVRDASGTVYEKRHEIARSRERLADLIEFLAQGMAETTTSLAEAMRELERMEAVAQDLRNAQAALLDDAQRFEDVRTRLLESSQQLRRKAEAPEEAIEAQVAGAQGAGFLQTWLWPGVLALAALVCLLSGIRELVAGLRPTA